MSLKQIEISPSSPPNLPIVSNTLTDQHGETESPSTDIGGGPSRSPFRVAIVMATLCIIVFLAALDTTIIATVAPTVSEQFNSPAGYVWVGSSYLLASAVASPSLARFSDVWGRKPLLLISNFIFFAGSLLAATSVSIGMLLAGRTLQGIGGGGIIVLVQIIISDLFSERDRAAYLAIIEVVWAVALALGPIIGGVFTEKVTWRWCFYINLPICALAFIVVILFLDLKTPETRLKDGLAVIDWTGTFLIIAGTLLLLFGLELGATSFPWSSPTTISLLVVGILTLIAFVLWEAHYAASPLMPMSVFSHRSTAATLAVTFLHGLVLISGSYFLPLYFQATLSATPLLSGVYFLPTTISTSTSSIAAGLFIQKTGNYRAPIFAGLALMALGHGLFIDLDAASPWPKIITYQVVAAAGVGPNFQAPLVALQAGVHPLHMASATATLNFLRNIAAAVSIVLGGVVFQARMEEGQGVLRGIVSEETARLFSGHRAVANVPKIGGLEEGVREVVRRVYADALGRMWVFYVCASGVALLASVGIGKRVLRGDVVEVGVGLEGERERGEMARVEREERKGGV